MSPPKDRPPLPPRQARALARRRRQTFTFLGLFTVVVLVGLVALGNWRSWWTIGGTAHAQIVACPTQILADPTLVQVNVYNGTTRDGLATAVAKELRTRGFAVKAVANEDEATPINAVVLVRYGTPGVKSARTVGRQFPGKVQMLRVSKNTRVVDVVIGTRYRAMLDRTKAAAAIALKPAEQGCVEPTATDTATPAN
jgi:hypothetical protein